MRNTNLSGFFFFKIIVVLCFITFLICARIHESEFRMSKHSIGPVADVATLQNFVPTCPVTPPRLLGKLSVNTNISLEEAEEKLANKVEVGGTHRPVECISRYRLAVIIPYRNREHQIGPFMNHIHPLLQRQQLDYSIFLVEQLDTNPFNRASLLNIGFLEALKERDFDCIAFHDIDLLCEDDRHLYHCSSMPRLLNVADSRHGYVPLPSIYVGGACLMGVAQVKSVNGWSNSYWGWGGEDDDMKYRMDDEGFVVWRYPKTIARYKMLLHKPGLQNPNRYTLLRSFRARKTKDGLNSVEYKNLTKIQLPLYTHIQVELQKH